MKNNGTASSLYPADLRSLFSYDSKQPSLKFGLSTHVGGTVNQIEALVRDFELDEVADNLRDNYNLFMSHIGLSFSQLLIVYFY